MDSGAYASDAARRRERLNELAEQVVGPLADQVDRDARFPSEALAALRAERLLSVAIPPSLGGAGAGISEVSAMCECLARHCSATAMVFAMHQIQVACLIRHGQNSSYFRNYLGELAEHQYLIASVTSEVGIGGDLRSSLAAVEPRANGFALSKHAPTVSYGEHTDELLVTARSHPDSPISDQVLVLLRHADYRLERTSAWDTLGMRGTCSPGFRVDGECQAEQILPDFANIASATMVPYSHVLWASVWLGIAADAVARARTMVRVQARKTPGSVPPTALRLAELNTALGSLRALLRALCDEYAELVARPDGGIETLTSIGFAIRINQLKVSASEQAVAIVSQALTLCGIAGYRNGTPQSLGRQLRDVYSSLLMIGNDRIHATNAQLLLVHKGD
jgi:acyl-CoA dehydrogenase